MLHKNNRAFGSMTRREAELLDELCSGLTHKEIAHKKHLAKSTVSTHFQNVMRKTGLNKETALAAFYTRQKYGILG